LAVWESCFQAVPPRRRPAGSMLPNRSAGCTCYPPSKTIRSRCIPVLSPRKAISGRQVGRHCRSSPASVMADIHKSRRSRRDRGMTGVGRVPTVQNKMAHTRKRTFSHGTHHVSIRRHSRRSPSQISSSEAVVHSHPIRRTGLAGSGTNPSFPASHWVAAFLRERTLSFASMDRRSTKIGPRPDRPLNAYCSADDPTKQAELNVSRC